MDWEGEAREVAAMDGDEPNFASQQSMVDDQAPLPPSPLSISGTERRRPRRATKKKNIVFTSRNEPAGLRGKQ